METVQNSINLRNWWFELEEQWKMALNEGFFNKGKSSEMPSEEELEMLYASEALRLVGPRGPYPNLSFELTNLSGVEKLLNLKTLVLGFGKIKDLKPLAKLTKLGHLFLFGNQIQSLEDIKHLTQLEELFVNLNELKDIKAVKNLTNLKSFYCNYNKLTSLEGITKKHRGTLKQLVCLPNDDLPDAEILRLENKLFIRCQRG